MKIKKIFAQELLDCRANPTIEVTILLENGLTASALTPAGKSTGSHEACELRDGDSLRYAGLGVLKAVDNVNHIISSALAGHNIFDQEKADDLLKELDGTPNKIDLGANALIAVSMAVVKAAALTRKQTLYWYIANLFGNDPQQLTLPTPLINTLTGGTHEPGGFDIQNYIIIPNNNHNFHQNTMNGVKVVKSLENLLKLKQPDKQIHKSECGFTPTLSNNEEGIQLLTEAIENAGFTPGKDFSIGLDIAASELFDHDSYDFRLDHKRLSSKELTKQYINWVNQYPLSLIEDSHDENDWEGFKEITKILGNQILIVGDDLFATNQTRLQRGIDQKCANAILIKPNQIGTVTETINTVKLARSVGYIPILSIRSGETEDTFLADFAVGGKFPMFKMGTLAHSDKVAKFNQLMRIETEIGISPPR